MPKHAPLESRRERIEQLFAENGWSGLDELDDWDGSDLDVLREILSDDEYQALLDGLGEDDERTA